MLNESPVVIPCTFFEKMLELVNILPWECRNEKTVIVLTDKNKGTPEDRIGAYFHSTGIVAPIITAENKNGSLSGTRYKMNM
jgi:hypothetical protein